LRLVSITTTPSNVEITDMTDRSDKAIEDLCVSYSAYVRAIVEKNDQAMIAWALCLITDQENTGVTMIPMERLRNSIRLRE
jgi:hypothetical protein